MCVLLNKNIPFKRRQDLDIFEEGKMESVFIEISAKNGRKLIVGCMYKPPNTDSALLVNSIDKIVSLARSNNGKQQTELIIGMYHNLDLLKGQTHQPTQQFINKTNELNLLPTITRPSQITSHSATLIDNQCVSEELHHNFESAILLNGMSDHLPLVTMLCQTKLLNKTPLTFESRCLTEDKLTVVKDHLMGKDWIDLLNGTTNENFDAFSQTVNEELDNVSPKCTIKISAKRRYTEPWMTKGLEKASNTKMRLYKTTLKPSHTEDDIEKYKMHQNLYNCLKRTTKATYYCEKCSQFKQNTKKLWGIINETIKKVKYKGSIIPHITVNGIKVMKPKEIANSFGEFYSQLGSELAKKLFMAPHQSWTTHPEYLNS